MACPARPRSPDDGEALDLHEGGDVPEPGHADGGHGRVVRPGQAPPDSADLFAPGSVVSQVRRVDGEAGQVLGPAAGGAERGEEDAERALELRDDITTDDRP